MAYDPIIAGYYRPEKMDNSGSCSLGDLKKALFSPLGAKLAVAAVALTAAFGTVAALAPQGRGPLVVDSHPFSVDERVLVMRILNGPR